MNSQVTITSAQRDVAIYPFKRDFISIVQDLLKYENVPPTRVHISFLTDSETKRLHNQYFNDPSSTDCMTFPVDEPEFASLPDGCLGEIVICPRTVIAESVFHKKSISYELKLYLVHALLHLVGYEDTTPAKRKKMKLREKMHMIRLEKKGLVP